jgi:hypothetical protein
MLLSFHSLLFCVKIFSSGGAQYVTMQKYIFHIQVLVTYLFSNPTHKTEIGTAERIGGRLLIANHFDQSEILSSSQIIFITLFSAGAQCCYCAVNQPQQKLCILLSQNQFPELNPQHVLTFLHPGSHTEHRWRCSNPVY